MTGETWPNARNDAGQPPATDQQRGTRMAELTRVLARTPNASTGARTAALRTACPFCGANPFQNCTAATRTRSTPHPSRTDAATQEATP